MAIRQVREGIGDIQWVARSPADPGTTVEILDEALALAAVSLHDLPRLTPGPCGFSEAREGRQVSIAWHEPRGAESHLSVAGSPQVPLVEIGWVEVDACAGTTTREVTLTFVEEQGAEALSIRATADL